MKKLKIKKIIAGLAVGLLVAATPFSAGAVENNTNDIFDVEDGVVATCTNQNLTEINLQKLNIEPKNDKLWFHHESGKRDSTDGRICVWGKTQAYVGDTKVDSYTSAAFVNLGGEKIGYTGRCWSTNGGESFAETRWVAPSELFGAVAHTWYGNED